MSTHLPPGHPGSPGAPGAPGAAYARDRQVDKPAIVGARWWHATLADQEAQIARRAAIRNILVAGGVIAGFGAVLAMCVKASSSGSGASTLPDDVTSQRKTSLEMQKEYGWSFGATTEALVFDGLTTKPFQPGALRSLTTDLSPSQMLLKPHFQSALFDSPDAVPPQLARLDPEEARTFRPLASSVLPIYTPAMEAAYQRGKSLASLFGALAEGATAASARTALIVDLAGPEAVAFAAGAAAVFDPVFLFDNWPHPRGVVRAHETLSAAAYYQPLFADAKKRAQGAARPPMFVLDRRRLTPYTDDATQFDNRYVAKLPTSAVAMRLVGVDHVLYVVPTRADAARELDDLNDEMVLYVKGGVDVRSLSLDMFGAGGAGSTEGEDPGTVFYGASRGAHHAFFSDYPWAKPARAATARPATNPGKSYAPQARVSPYSSGNPGATATNKPRPPTFGTVPVAVAVGTGIILGARYSRSGSWNRTSGSSWGGG